MLGEVQSDNSQHLDSRSEFSSPAFRAALEWIQKILGISIHYKDGFRSVLSSGEILCNLLNAIVPGGIKRINRCPNRASAIDNLSLFLAACEDKCGIPRSQLFSIDDFEDIFDRKLDTNASDEKNAKRSEKVVVSLLWLAKYADRTPKCKHLPKLNYEAFLGLLPRTFIRSSALFVVRENSSLEFKTLQPLEELSRKWNPDKEHTLQKSQLPLSEASKSDQFSQEACSLTTMGNFQSAAPAPVPPKEPILHSSPSPSCEHPSEQQINNNGMEEDEWQADLLDWREKRRKFSRMHATKMMTLEEVQQEEELKRQEAVKDRMRQIKAQRSLGADQYIPSSSILRPIPPSSPGMALLIGGGSEFFDNSDDLVSNEAKAVGEISGQADESSAFSSAPMAIKSAPPHINGFHQMVPDITHEPTEATDIDHLGEENVCGSALVTPNPDSHATDPGFASTSENGLREVRVYIQSNSKSIEPRWGMTIRAEGPSRTAPFVVDRVKIGSTADVCDVTKGDVLLKLNGTDLRRNPDSQRAYTLQELELLMDQCSLSSKPVDLRLLRRKSQNDELSDCDVENEAIVDGLNGEHSPPDSPAYTSDVDSQEFHEDVLAVDRVALTAKSIAANSTQEHQPIHNDMQLKSRIKVVTPEFNGPKGQESSNPSPKFSSESQTEAQHWTLDLPLKKSLKTQIVNTSEVGASHLQSPTQSDGSSASQLASTRGLFKTEASNTEPIAVSVGARDVREIRERVLLVRQPTVNTPEVETVPLVPNNSVENTHVRPTGTPVTYVPHSPLPPPPLLPLNVTWAPEPSVHMRSFPSGARYSVSENDNRKIELNTEFDPSTPILPDCTYSPALPSPPPLLLFPQDMHTCTHTESATYPSVGPLASECLNKTSGREPSVTSAGARYSVSRKSASTASGDLQTHQGRLSTSRCTRVQIIPSSESEISRSSSRVPHTPLPAPSAPLLALSTSGSSILYSQYSQANGPSKFSTDSRDESTQGSLAQRRLHPSAHPFLPMATEAPPQPPRVPLNRGVNPKSKCNACNQELGTGDLMIINSMGLYYHLACFVCSRCGVPLSDGLSNAEVRIRSGQLYCQLCYPSRSGRQKMVPQSDSDRRSPASRQQDPQYACSDRRQRPRGSSIHSNESGSRMSPRSYF